MAKLSVDTESLDGMIKRLKRLQSVLPGGPAGALPSTLKTALGVIGDKTIETLMAESPVADDTRPDFHDGSKFHDGKKHLRDSWKWELNTKGTVIEGFAYVEPDSLNDLIDLLQAGSPAHPITASAGSVLSFYVRKGNTWERVYSRAVNHPGFPPNKFVDRAREKTEKYVRQIIDAVQQDFNRIITG